MRISPTGPLTLALALVLVLAGPGAAQGPMNDHGGHMGGNTYLYVAFDELELATSPAARPLIFDGESWIGGDLHRLWLKASGEHGSRGEDREGDFALQALYSRAISPFWNLQVGPRVDHSTGAGETGTRLGLGLEGLAPYWFEVEAFVFVGGEGDVTASLEASYDLLLTQRLVLEPEMEVQVASRARLAFGLGSGVTHGETGLRLRYELRRELAPYIGYRWERLFGDTAERARDAGEETTEGTLVAGLRWWY